jgi:hypothetical protein
MHPDQLLPPAMLVSERQFRAAFNMKAKPPDL